MTLINLSKKNTVSIFNSTFLLLAMTALCAGLLLVYRYNRVVNTKFEIRRMEESMERLLTRNAELKVNLHAAIAPDKLTAVSEQIGLVKEVRPRYYAHDASVVARAGQ